MHIKDMELTTSAELRAFAQLVLAIADHKKAIEDLDNLPILATLAAHGPSGGFGSLSLSPEEFLEKTKQKSAS